LKVSSVGGDNKGGYMDQAISEHSESEPFLAIDACPARRDGILPALAVAIIATALIAEAVFTIINGRANGDMMIMVCPILGSLFLSIPAVRAWWVVLTFLRRR